MTKEELRETNPSDILLIDIREGGEVEALPSPSSAVHIAMSKLVQVEASGELPKDKKLVTICHSGGRCLAVNQYLKSKGYDVDYLEGGMMNLSN